MKRTKFNKINVPDAIYVGLQYEFTQVPNHLLRNPELSAKAKIILCVLLSNKKGWKTYATTIKDFLKEGTDAVNSGIKELETQGYLLRCKIRHEKTKIVVGSFWAYTDTPLQFNIRHQVIRLLKKNYETLIKYPEMGKPNLGFPDVEFPEMGNPRLIILNNNNIKNKNTKSSSFPTKEEEELFEEKKKKLPLLFVKEFDKFWELYPRKQDKGKAFKAWEKLCKRSNNMGVTWKIVKRAILSQMKSPRWQNPNFIALPATWINQNRWMDNESTTGSFERKQNVIGHRDTEFKYREPDVEM